MVANFHPKKFEKLKDGKVHVKGTILLDADIVIDPDGGKGGGGGGGNDHPVIDIDLKERADAKWIYGRGTPGWAISAAQSIGYETIRLEDLPPNYPWE